MLVDQQRQSHCPGTVVQNQRSLIGTHNLDVLRMLLLSVRPEDACQYTDLTTDCSMTCFTLVAKGTVSTLPVRHNASAQWLMEVVQQCITTLMRLLIARRDVLLVHCSNKL